MSLLTRTRLAGLLVLLLALAPAAVPIGARAETAEPSEAQEGWFAKTKPRAPQIPTPVGAISPGEVPAPQSPDTGAYVVSGALSAGADQGDTGWIVFEWDLLSYIGATVNRFEATFTQAPDNRGDFGTPVIQGCDVVEPFGAAPGPNPFEDRPVVSCSSAVVPTAGTDGNGRATYTFELTDLATRWVEGESYGLAILPGTPEQESGFGPFQLTLAGYNSTAEEAPEVRPRVVLEFTPAGDGGLGSALDAGPAAPAPFEPTADVDVFPDDVGSQPLPTPDAGADTGDETAAPPAQDVPTAPVSRSDGSAWFVLWLLPLGLVGYWVLGTVLGPAGEPLPVRQGGVTRLLAHRRAGAGPTPSEGGSP